MYSIIYPKWYGKLVSFVEYLRLFTPCGESFVRVVEVPYFTDEASLLI